MSGVLVPRNSTLIQLLPIKEKCSWAAATAYRSIHLVPPPYTDTHLLIFYFVEELILDHL